MAATVACPDCGTAVAPDARFCASCGTRQPERDGVTREVRKLATVVFADVTGSTALGERLDPEALRALMTRYFVAMRTVIERHGGRVEKFIGDAVMAVFGIPAVHEDDALRAVRAAWEIREVLQELSQQLETERRVSIRFRTGINTGEVVAGDPLTGTTLVTGDTVNTAARLEQAAPPGEVLLGELTYWLVRDAVDAEPVEPVAAKGKAALISAYRLTGVRVRAEGRARRLDAPMVGRAAELDLVAAAWKEAVASAMPRLLTVLAPAGVGKSRLVREVILRIRGTGGVALVGRCLPYGDGITYWPIRELVHGAAGISEADDQTAARERVEALLRDAPDGVRVAARIGSAIGLSTDPAPMEEVFWAIRRLLAHLASAQPTLVVLEDLHWAEDTLLDLVDTLAGSELTGAVLVLTTARPELAERREGSLASRPVTDVLRLGPLGNDDAGELLDALPGGAALPPSVRDRMLTAAEGNPLYVEELLGLLRDEGKIRESASGWEATPDVGDMSIPVSIQALLAARLEALPEDERATARRASVMGRSFESAALVEIDPARAAGMATQLAALVRKELLRPDRPELTAGDAFRFRHVLIRDAAYEALPKAERAVLHERFSDWLERAAGDRRAEVEEIVGYHLEQALGYRTDLGEWGEPVDALRDRAAAIYRSAGMRADRRGDTGSTVALLSRALALEPAAASGSDLARLALADALIAVTREGEARAILSDLRSRAAARGDLAIEARAAMLDLLARAGLADPALRTPEFEALAAELQPLIEASGDDVALARFWNSRSGIEWDHSRWDASMAATERGLRHAERAGDVRMVQYAWISLATAAISGPTPLSQALERMELWLLDPDLQLEVKGELLDRRGLTKAMLGRVADGRHDVREARSLLREIGRRESAALCLWTLSCVERYHSNLEAELEALDAMLPDLQQLARLGAAARGDVLAKLGDVDAAEVALDESEGEDWELTVRRRMIGRARVAVARGAADDALRQADRFEAMVRSQGADWANALSEALIEAGVVAALAGEPATAARRAAEALELARSKGNLALARKARAILAGDLERL